MKEGNQARRSELVQKPSDATEKAFEEQIEKALLADGFVKGVPRDFDSSLALDLRRLWHFLETTQSETLAAYKGMSPMRETVPQVISARVRQFGILEVLREGVDVENIHLALYYPKPSESDSEESKAKYAQNEFSVTRQQTFSLTNPGLEIDMVIFVNGMPLFTFELKNPWTGQTARYNGRKQYREDRNPGEPLLNFGRCLAHFTLDKDEVFFTTKLDGKKTYFMPFNKGLPNGQGAGNPVNPNGFKTSYLRESILTKSTISDIIQNYALFDYGEAKTGKKVPHILKNAKKLIFPRYHQLDVVNRLLENAESVGVGERYLIQHSAGSGKSNSLTWLAYKLIGLTPKTMEAKRARRLDAPLFDSVLVVTDRRLLDKQISDNIKLFGHSANIVQHADSSSMLKSARRRRKSAAP